MVPLWEAVQAPITAGHPKSRPIAYPYFYEDNEAWSTPQMMLVEDHLRCTLVSDGNEFSSASKFRSVHRFIVSQFHLCNKQTKHWTDCNPFQSLRNHHPPAKYQEFQFTLFYFPFLFRQSHARSQKSYVRS